jgi:hypothetical protein
LAPFHYDYRLWTLQLHPTSPTALGSISTIRIRAIMDDRSNRDNALCQHLSRKSALQRTNRITQSQSL